MIATWVVLTVIGFAGAATFTGLYASLPATRRTWYQSDVGRNLMAMAVVLAGLLGLSLLALLAPVWPVLWLAGMASLDAVLWWRVALLVLAQRR